jgi:AcrR family transcriptional regulator
MTSTRNKQASRTEEDSLLDAARTVILAVGLRRSTLTDVARQAGVSRMTIYRRWPDMATLVGDLMTRELGAVTTAAMAATEGGAPGGGTARERLAGALVTALRTLRRHPMFRRIVELDPEVLLPYLVDRRGRSQDHMLAAVTGAVAGAADGSIRPGDPALLARAVLLALSGFLLSMRTMTDGCTEEALDAEARLLLDRYLAP